MLRVKSTKCREIDKDEVAGDSFEWHHCHDVWRLRIVDMATCTQIMMFFLCHPKNIRRFGQFSRLAKCFYPDLQCFF